MDEKDKQIIELLRENARMPFTKIADEIGVTESTIRKRVKSLEKRGVIEGYTAEVDPGKMGYGTTAIVGLDVESEYLLKAVEDLKKVEEVKSISTSTGDHMIMMEVWAKDNSHLSEVVFNKIGGVKGVKDLCPAIVLEEIKT
ncbi:MAG: AsnC family transcriptional regulator [Candidatus Aenigmatarchaeota archaeon]